MTAIESPFEVVNDLTHQGSGIKGNWHLFLFIKVFLIWPLNLKHISLPSVRIVEVSQDSMAQM